MPDEDICNKDRSVYLPEDVTSMKDDVNNVSSPLEDVQNVFGDTEEEDEENGYSNMPKNGIDSEGSKEYLQENVAGRQEND